MYFRFLLYAFLIYLLYRLVFHFIIPIYKTTKQVKNQFKDMQSHMQEQMKKQEQSYHSANSNKSEAPKEKAGDYIDFEELK
jgi:hypothetical protein